MNIVDYIIEYENGQLSDKQTLELFANLIKTGQVWSLQGCYGRTGEALIQDGFISKTGQITEKGKLY